MARPDDELRRLGRERLHTVAYPGVAAGEGVSGAAAAGEPDELVRPAGRGRPRPERHTDEEADALSWLSSAPTDVLHPDAAAGPERAHADLRPGHPPDRFEGERTAAPVPARRPRHRAVRVDPLGPSQGEPWGAGDPRRPWGPVAARLVPGSLGTPPQEVAVSQPGRADASAPADDDVRDVVERMRREALAEVAEQYTRLHGHPLEHAAMDVEPPRRRWFLTVRHAVVAGIAVTLLTAGVVVRATAEVPRTVPPPAATTVAGGTAEPSAGAAAGATPSPGPIGAEAGAPVTPADPAGIDGAPDQRVVVHVVGQVNAPGVVQLPVGSRVGDALSAAGGATPAADVSAVNLARVLVDGEQVVVPSPGDPASPVPAAPGAAGASGPAAAAAVVDLNAAGMAELDALPGIGPVLAQRILDWRADNGPFRDVEELGEVPGIGDTLLGRLRPMVRV